MAITAGQLLKMAKDAIEFYETVGSLCRYAGETNDNGNFLFAKYTEYVVEQVPSAYPDLESIQDLR